MKEMTVLPKKTMIELTKKAIKIIQKLDYKDDDMTRIMMIVFICCCIATTFFYDQLALNDVS